MFSTTTRMIFVAVTCALGAAALWQGYGRPAVALFFVAGVMLYGWMRYGAISAARRQLRAGRIERAWAMLESTPFGGRLLARGLKPTFHLVRCACLIDLGRYPDVIREAETVLGLKTNAANVSTAHAALAQAYLGLERRAEARNHLVKARALPHKSGLDRMLSRIAAELGDEVRGSEPQVGEGA